MTGARPNHQPIRGSDPNHQDLESTQGGAGTSEEPCALTQGVNLFSLVHLVWESNPKLQGGWCKPNHQSIGGSDPNHQGICRPPKRCATTTLCPPPACTHTVHHLMNMGVTLTLHVSCSKYKNLQRDKLFRTLEQQPNLVLASACLGLHTPQLCELQGQCRSYQSY